MVSNLEQVLFVIAVSITFLELDNLVFIISLALDDL